MARYFVPITIKDFQQKVLDALRIADQDVLDLGSLNNVKTWDDINPDNLYHILNDIRQLTPTIEKDLKVKFDTENLFAAAKDGSSEWPPLGFQIHGDLTFLGIMAGGDWEYPVYFIIYWDGKKLRAYVPTEGNPWNTDVNEAYGNDHESDVSNIKKRYPDIELDSDYITDFLVTEPNKVIADIANRIIRKP